MPPAIGTHRRQPAKFDGEDLHQQHPEGKCRKGDTGHRQRHPQPVRPAIAPHRRGNSRRHTKHHRPAHAGQRQPQRRHKAAGDLAAHRASRGHRDTEIALQHAGDIVPELDVQRPIEPQLLAHHRDNLRIGLRSGNQPRRVAGQHMHKQKNQHRHDQQGGNQPQQAFKHIIQHRPSSPEPSARTAEGARPGTLSPKERVGIKVTTVTGLNPPAQS
nr:Uncharacterised protein [Raoultella sp. NCTC 9187]